MASTITVDKIKGGTGGVALTLPTDAGGANQLLKTDGVGTLSWAADSTTDSTKLPLAGGALTGAVTTNSTFDGVDIAVRDGVLTTTTTTANAALPKAGGTMTGAITTLAITETEATSAAATYTVDLANGTIFEVTHATLCTVTMPTAAAGKSFTVISTVPAAWVGTIKWSGSAAPTGGVGISIYSFISNGTNWYGMRAGTNFG